MNIQSSKLPVSFFSKLLLRLIISDSNLEILQNIVTTGDHLIETWSLIFKKTHEIPFHLEQCFSCKRRARWLNLTSHIQGPVFCIVILANMLCLWIVSKKEELQSLDYFLVIFQSSIDLIFTGCFGFLDYFLDLWAAFIYFCSYSGFHDVGVSELYLLTEQTQLKRIHRENFYCIEQ